MSNNPANDGIHARLIALQTMLQLALSLHIAKLPRSERTAVLSRLDVVIKGPIDGKGSDATSMDVALLAYEHMRHILDEVESWVRKMHE